MYIRNILSIYYYVPYFVENMSLFCTILCFQDVLFNVYTFHILLWVICDCLVYNVCYCICIYLRFILLWGMCDYLVDKVCYSICEPLVSIVGVCTAVLQSVGCYSV